MKILISAYSKSLPSHKVFIGDLKAEDIGNTPSPSRFDGKIRCRAIKAGTPLLATNERLYIDRDGDFEPVFRMDVAAELRLNGNYRVKHVIKKSELICMLASVLQKSDIEDVMRQLEHLVGE